MMPAFLNKRIILGAALAAGLSGASVAGAAPPAPAPVPPKPIATFTVAPTLTIAELRPGGTEVSFYAITSEPTSLTYSVQKTLPPGSTTGVRGGLTGVTTGTISTGGTPPPPVFDTKHPVT